MRPAILNALFSDIKSLAGVGPKSKQSFERLFGNTRLIDAVFHLPIGCLDRRKMPDLTRTIADNVITAVVEIIEHLPPKRKTRQPFKVICKNETGYLTITFFNGKEEYITKNLPVGQKRVVSGRVEYYDGMLQMSHPDYMLSVADINKVLIIEPVYPLTYAVSQKMIIKLVRNAIDRIPQLPEWIGEDFCAQQKWNGWNDCIKAVHKLNSPSDIEPSNNARRRLAYDELLANQLALALSRTRVKRQNGQSIIGNGSYRKKLEESLPFSLTAGQKKILADIDKDMASKDRMLRLLQGDVGAGKTVVALVAMLNAVEAGKQCALMAPTEILARQHGGWIEKVIADAGLDICVHILTGKDKGKARDKIINGIAEGSVNIIIGTHALFQESVEFKDLGFVVIDEQHRFGVKQRLSLSNKGENTDILMMTATPIPRTLTLTMYGDIDVSLLKEKPAGRLPIDTRIMPIKKVDDVVAGLKRAVAEGNRAYWVCPLIEEGDGDEPTMAAAESRFRELKFVFPDRIGLIHGKMKADEKHSTMLAFKNGELDVLVATTVIEVGVDVPESTIIVIEHAEQFGLSQLHQLRGRVGRGGNKSNCILLYSYKLSEVGKKRLQIMRDTEDGFLIAEEDLLLRGSGEILGTKQSGMPDFKLATFPEHNDLLLIARDDVKVILQNDEKLTSPRGQNLRNLLYLFEYDSHMQYIEAG